MKQTIYDLQSADWEKTVEMHYLLKFGARSIDRFINEGYGVYPEILTLMVSLGYYAEVQDVLSVAKKYDPVKLRDWLEAYYEEEWKSKVILYELEDIAVKFFSSEECAQAKLWNALKWKSDWTSKDLLAEKFGIKYLKQICDQWRAEIKRNEASECVKDCFADMERYLASRGEFEYLLKHHSWLALSRQFDAFKYLESIGNYSAVISCVEYGSSCMKKNVKLHVCEVLDNADLSEQDKLRYDKIYDKLHRNL
ncbi:MAG: hypothetical protein IJS88_05175 [Alphaproteobacteria bacterium]|nr:hypothetical protein [Alphaproteobacteria bacterium]